MGLTTPGSDTGMFPNDPQMVLFKGGIRKGEMIYLHKVPKDLFIKHNNREWYSKPDVKEITPIEIKKIPVDKYLNLIRTATPQDLELQKKYMKKQGVAEGSNDTIYPNAEVIKSKNGKPIGEIYQDGNSWGAFHYRADRGYDFIDSREEAIEALRDLHQETGRSRPDYTIKGVAEGNDDHIWGPQGNFAGDRIVNLGGVTMKTVEVGDTVKYFGQKAKVVAMSKDRKHSRINILSDFGGTTRDVLTSDLKQLGQGVAEGYEPGDKITWYHSNHHPEIEGTVVGWKDGHLIVKSIDPQPRNTEKTVAKYRVPKNNILSHDKQGVAEEKIQEIQRKPDDPVGYSTDNRIVKSSDLKGLKMIPGSNRLGYSFGPMVTAFTGATHGIHLYDIKNRRLVGYLALAKSAFPLPKSYRVANVNIDDDYRGQGLGQTLYGIAIKLLGLTIEADDTQTAASRRMWVALSQIPGVEINGYAKIWADEWDKRDTPNEIYDDSELRVIRALIKAGGEELGRSHSSVYVSFPVGSNADKSELQSIQKGLAIYSRLHPEDGGTDNGLYARWGGQVREQGVAESSNKKQEATRRIQKMLNDKFDANLDVDGVLGPLTLKSINKFMPNAKVGPAEDPNKTTAVQGKKVKNKDTDQNQLAEKWSQKYKSSINCSNPKGFSQRAHCDGKNKNEDVTETAEYNYSNINDDDWYEFNSEGNVVRQSGPRRYELPFGSNKTIKLPNGNIAAKGMTAKRLKLFKNLSESREYYNVMCTDAKSLRQDFNMSKDRHGWFLKEGSTSKQKLDVYRAFGSPKLKEYDLSAFSGGTQTKGEDNVISPVGSQTRAQYKK
jgi:hypothetical protein